MTIFERVAAMSDNELWAHLEDEQPTPAVMEVIKRFRVYSDIEIPQPEPYTPSCTFCGGAGRVGLGTKCTHCQGKK